MFTFSCLGLLALCSCWHRLWIPHLQVEVGLSLRADPGSRKDLGREALPWCAGAQTPLCAPSMIWCFLFSSLHERLIYGLCGCFANLCQTPSFLPRESTTEKKKGAEFHQVWIRKLSLLFYLKHLFKKSSEKKSAFQSKLFVWFCWVFSWNILQFS